VLDYTTALKDVLMETECGGLTYRYTYGTEKVSSVISGPTYNPCNLYQNGAAKLYFHQDRLGSTDIVTDNIFGGVVSYIDYNEWGAPVKKSNLKLGSREVDMVSYTGYAYDPILSLYYAKARFYDYTDKRFVEVDPVKGNIYNPQTLVQYTYVLDNPLKYIDPTGTMSWTQIDDLIGGMYDGILQDFKDTLASLADVVNVAKDLIIAIWKKVVTIDDILYAVVEDYVYVVQNADIVLTNKKASNEEVHEYGKVLGAVIIGLIGMPVNAGGAIAKKLPGLAKRLDKFAEMRCNTNLQNSANELVKMNMGPEAKRAFETHALEGAGRAVIGNKLEYVFGNATGTIHNIERSADMERQLNRIGIFDNAEGRSIVQRHLEEAFENTTNGVVQTNGRTMKESLLVAPNGIVKVQSIWEGNNLITVEIFGGGR
jgi:RHS repeat-associated protein